MFVLTLSIVDASQLLQQNATDLIQSQLWPNNDRSTLRKVRYVSCGVLKMVKTWRAGNLIDKHYYKLPFWQSKQIQKKHIQLP